MPFSPLEILDEDYSGLFPESVEKYRGNVSKKEVKNNRYDKSVTKVHVDDKQLLDSEKENSRNYSPINQAISGDGSEQFSSQDESKTFEDNQLTNDNSSSVECSGIGSHEKKLDEKEEEGSNDNLQRKPFHQTNEARCTPTSMSSMKDGTSTCSDVNDNSSFTENTKSGNDQAKPSDDIEPIIKPTIRTKRHIPNSNQQITCDIILTDQNDPSLINNTLVLTSKEQQQIINNDKNNNASTTTTTDIIIKSTSQSIENMKLSSPIKQSNSSSCLVNQKAASESTTHQQATMECPMNAVALRNLAYQTWRSRSVQSARIERLTSLRNEIDETKKEKEKLERLKSNENSFQAWKQSKHQLLIDTIKKQKAEQLAQKQKLEEEQERKMNSEKAFNAWKSLKDETIKKQRRDYLSKQKHEKHYKEIEQHEKQSLNQQAFEKWKAKKDDALKQSLQFKLKHQNDKEKQLEEANRLKMEQAAEAYRQWELKKMASLENRAISMDSLNTTATTTARRPWRPPSKTISLSQSYRMY